MTTVQNCVLTLVSVKCKVKQWDIFKEASGQIPAMFVATKNKYFSPASVHAVTHVAWLQFSVPQQLSCLPKGLSFSSGPWLFLSPVTYEMIASNIPANYRHFHICVCHSRDGAKPLTMVQDCVSTSVSIWMF